MFNVLKKKFKIKYKNSTFWIGEEGKNRLELKIKNLNNTLEVIGLEMKKEIPYSDVKQVEKDFDIVKEILNQNIILYWNISNKIINTNNIKKEDENE